MKLTHKISILPAVSIIGILAIGSVYLWSDHNRAKQTDMLNQSRALTAQVVAVKDTLKTINTSAYQALVMSNMGFSEQLIQARSDQSLLAIKSIDGQLQGVANAANQEYELIINQISTRAKKYQKSASSVFDMVMSDATYGTQLMGAAEKDFEHLSNDMQAFSDMVFADHAAIRKEIAHVENIQFNLIIGSALLAMLIVLGVAIQIIREIERRSQYMRDEMSNISTTSRFNKRLEMQGDDEFSSIAHSFNNLMSDVSGVISEASKVVGAIAKGDFAQHITGNYVGDFGVLKQCVNASSESISFTMSELHKVMQGLEAGNFNIKLDNNKVEGEYRNIVDSAIGAINTTHGVVNDINSVMHQMNEGDFNARVNADAAGDLLTMKNNINASMERLAMIFLGITSIVSAQAEGDLTKSCVGDFNGQLHDLKNAINYSSEKMKETVIQAVNASNIVNEAANQVSQGASDLSSRVQEQASALEETSATMNEMASAVQANTSNARKVADLAHQVQNQSGTGVEVMQQTIDAMKSIQESSHKISDIVTIIDSIAFQTNLLALNAAVEAARAGEHGRGFAVVASEVRALAGKSADAAKDIKGLIEDSVNRIQAGTQLADKSGEMLNGISSSIEQVATMIEQIATASNEQSTGINQVHRAVADIDKVTQENAALVEETTAAAESLTTEAEGLRDSMAFFKTGQQASQGSRTPPSRPSARPHSAPAKKPAALPAPNKGNGEEWGEF